VYTDLAAELRKIGMCLVTLNPASDLEEFQQLLTSVVALLKT